MMNDGIVELWRSQNESWGYFAKDIWGPASLHVVEEPDLKEVVKSAHTALDSIALLLFVLYELVEFDKDWTGRR